LINLSKRTTSPSPHNYRRTCLCLRASYDRASMVLT